MSLYPDTQMRKAEARAIPMAEVVARLGIEGLKRHAGELVGPCPVCGGKDRFAVHLTKAVFNCRICQANGDGIALVSHVMSCGFGEALDFLLGKAALQISPEERDRRKRRAEAEERKRQAAAKAYRDRAIEDGRDIWFRSVPAKGTPVEAYLAARGIVLDALPKTIQFLADHPYIKTIDGRGRELHRGPCMIAAVTDPTGRVTAAHQTWIDPDRPGEKARIKLEGQAMPAKLVRGSKKGAAIRLTGARGRNMLIMGEGIETTFSALVAGTYPQAAYWAGVDLGNLSGRMRPADARPDGSRPKWSGLPDMTDGEAFVPPPWITRLIFVMDGDSHPASTEAKLMAGLRRAMAVVPGLTGAIVRAEPGKDLNDMLRDSEEG